MGISFESYPKSFGENLEILNIEICSIGKRLRGKKS